MNLTVSTRGAHRDACITWGIVRDPEEVRAMPTVDVIIPCCNYGRYLHQCADSVLSRSAVTVRVLIIDDASSDDTPEVGQKLAAYNNNVEFRRHLVNKGHIATYNEGIEWVSADYMLILSADDYLLPGALSRAVTLMGVHPEVGFVFGKAIETYDHSKPNLTSATNEVHWRVLTGLEFIERSRSHNIVPAPTAVIRSELQKQVGGYLPELPHSGDMEMWLRLAAHASVGILESFQAVYRHHSRNMYLAYRTEGLLPDLQQRKAALDCFFRACSPVLPNAERLRKKLFWALACDAIGLASSALNEGETAVCERLIEVAFQLSPNIKASLPWLKLACKRYMPDIAWRPLRRAVADMRRVASSLKEWLTNSG